MADKEAGKAYITLRADEAAITADIGKVRQRLKAALEQIERSAKFKIQVDTRPIADLETKLKNIRREMQNISGTTVRPSFDTGGVDKANAQTINLRDALQSISSVTVRPTVDTSDIGRVSRIPDQTFNVNADTSGAVSEIGLLKGSIGSLAAVAGSALALMGVVNLAKTIGTFAVTTTAALEQVQVAFGGMFGNEKTADKFIGELQQFAAVTPFEFDQLTSSAQRLLGTFGKQFKDELIPTLTTIGDVAGALGADASAIDRVVVALSQIQGKGRVATEELNQIREALPGFNAVKAVADGLGITLPEATKKLEKGAIGASDGIKFLLEGMEKFPGAAGAMDRQSKTLNGRISTLKDTVKLAAIDGFNPLTAAVGEVVTTLAEGLGGSQFDSIIKGLNDSLTVGLKAVAPAIIPVIADIGTALGNIFTAIGPILGELLPLVSRALVPLSEILAVLIEVGGEVAIKLATAVIPILETLAGVIEDIPIGVLVGLAEAFVAMQIVGTITGLLSSVAAGLVAVGGAAGVAGAGITAALGPIGIALAALTFLAIALADGDEYEESLAKRVQVTEDMSAALTANTIELLANIDAVKGITTIQRAALNAAQLFTASFKEAAGEEFSRSLSTLGLNVADMMPQLLSLEAATRKVMESFDGTGPLIDVSAAAIEAAGGSYKEAFNKIISTGLNPELVGGLRKEFGALANTIIGTALQGGDLETVMRELQVRTNELGVESVNLTEDQKAQIEAFIGLSGAVRNVDFDELIRNTILEISATDEASQAALELAEAETGVLRSTTNTKDAIRLYNEFLLQAAKSAVILGTTDPTPDLSGLQGELAAILTPLQRSVAQAGALKGALVELSGSQIVMTESISNLEALKDKMTGATLTPLELANTAAQALKATLDAISGKKLNMTELISNAEKLNDALTTVIEETDKDAEGNVIVVGSHTGVRAAEEGKSGVDLATEAGRVNTKTITELAVARRLISDQVFAETGNIEFATQAYSDSIARLRDDYINAGGAAADFDEVIRNNALDPVTYVVAVDEASKKALLRDLGVMKAEEGKSGIDLTTGAGRTNTAAVLAYYDAIKVAASQVLIDTQSTTAAVETYASEVAILRENYIAAAVAAGDTAESAGADFDKLSKDHSLMTLDFKVTADETMTTTLLKELETAKSLTEGARASIKLSILSGDFDAASAQLDALSQVIITPVDPELVGSSVTVAQQGLILLTLAKSVALNPELSAEYVAKANADLEILARARKINLIPGAVSTTEAGGLTPAQQRAIVAAGGDVPVYAGGFFAAFRAGGFSQMHPLRGTVSHMLDAATIATQGPRFMYGEPSTHGEAFISLHPDFKTRNTRIWSDVGRRLGVQHGVSTSSGGSVDTSVTHELARMVSRLERLESAFMTMPPITIVPVAGDTSNAATKLWWEQRKRFGR